MIVHINPYNNKTEDFPSTENCEIKLADNIKICRTDIIKKDSSNIVLEDREYEIDFGNVLQLDEDATIGVVLDSNTIIEPNRDNIIDSSINKLDVLKENDMKDIPSSYIEKIYYTNILQKSGYRSLMYNLFNLINNDKSHYTYCDGIRLILKSEEYVFIEISDYKYETAKLYFNSIFINSGLQIEMRESGVYIKNKDNYTISIDNPYLLFDGFNGLDTYKLFNYDIITLSSQSDIARNVDNLVHRAVMTMENSNNDQISSMKEELKEMYKQNIEDRIAILENIAMYNLMESENRINNGDDNDD